MSARPWLSYAHIEAIPKITLSEAAFEKLVRALIQGSWKEDDRIPPERELSQRLGIGRASLREGLKALELIGMLESKVGGGTFVCPRSEFLSRPLRWAITGTDRSELRDMVAATARGDPVRHPFSRLGLLSTAKLAGASDCSWPLD